MSNATPKNASSFTFQHLEMILNAIRFDPRFVGCVDYGSTSEGRGDEWSDLDLAFFVRDEDVGEVKQNWKEWASQFGKPLLMFPGVLDHPWVVYDAEPIPLRADFAFHPESTMDIILEWPNSPLSVEDMVLYDETDGRLSDMVGQLVGKSQAPKNIEETFERVCGGFWYYLVRLEGCIHRNELMDAAWQFNFIVVANLCALLKIQHDNLARFRSSDSTSGIEKAITPIQYMRLKRCVAGPHVGELRRSMLEAAKLGSEVCQSISDKHGWEWPSELAERVIQLNQR